MLDTEQSSEPSNEQAFGAVMAEAESVEVEPAETPAVPADKAPDPPPVEAPPTETPPAVDSPPVTETPVETPADETLKHTPFALRVDQREVPLSGAYEDGENIVIPKTTWHTEVKNYLADRSQFQRMQHEWHQERRQLQEQRTVTDQVASGLLTELQRISELPEAESFGEWEKLRADYPKKKLELQNKVLEQDRTSRETQEQQNHEAQLVEQHVSPRLQEHLKGAISHEIQTAHQEAVKLVEKLPEADRAKVRQALEARIYEQLWGEAEEGRLYYRNGQVAVLDNGVQVPDVVPDVQRIARVVRREVEGMREALDLRVQVAKIEQAAKDNAAKAAARQTPVPPALSAKGTVTEPVKDKQPSSFADVYDEALNS